MIFLLLLISHLRQLIVLLSFILLCLLFAIFDVLFADTIMKNCIFQNIAFLLNDTFMSSASATLASPLPYDSVCAQVVMTYQSLSQGMHSGRSYSQNPQLCYVYLPPQASKNLLSGSTLYALVGGGVGVVVLLALVAVIIIMRRRRASAEKAKKERAEALRPRLAIEVRIIVLFSALLIGNIIITMIIILLELP